ncbi:site-specific integrase [Mesorhizobium sp. M0751]|uniref:tyrosine-type recombinase/integrase n=1 Tax=unclassified Mesorhizobium TaxID=325217 RepID=UPI00333D8527
MAKTVKDAKLENPTARKALAVGKRPHWKTLVPERLHLGYRRKSRDAAGVWLVRRYVGRERYRVSLLGTAHETADESSKAPGTFTFEEAQKLALLHRNVVEGRPKTSNLTVAEAIEDYIRYLKAEKKSGKDAEGRANALIIPTLGKYKISELTKRQIEKWRDDLAKKGRLLRSKKGKEQKTAKAPETENEIRARKATVNRTLTTLKAALNRAYAENDEIADKPDAWRTVKPFGKVDAARPDFLSVAEAQRLINAADRASGFRDLVHGALLTGCRYGELCALKVRDFAGGKIMIHTSKSGKPRTVRLTEEGAKFFTAFVAGRAGDEPMFRRDGSHAWKESSQGRPMREACKAAKIVPAVGFHQLRHTWASLAVMNGTPLMVVAMNLGHRDTTMVERHYAHLTSNFIDEAIMAGAPRYGAVEMSNVTAIHK